MKKNRSNKSKNLILGCLGSLFALTIISTPLSVSNISLAEADTQFSGGDSGFSVVVHDKDGNIKDLSATKTQVNLNSNYVDCYYVQWKDISYFEINFEDSLVNMDTYSYQYNLKWAPVEVIDNAIDFKNDRVEYIDLISTTVETKTEITRNLKYFIEEKAVTNGINTFKASGDIKEKQKETGEWGVYQFSFTCNGETWSSDLYEVRSTKIAELTEHPFINTTAIRSNYSIDNAYLCTITDNEYKYVNRRDLKWSVKGRGSNGSNYVLMPEDKASGDNTTKTILSDNSYNRTGLSFTFDFEVSGNWEISCDAIDPVTGDKMTSNVIEVSTVKVVPSYLYIIVIGAVVLAATVALVVIIILSKKKERIW